jgi:hypothetical protein
MDTAPRQRLYVDMDFVCFQIRQAASPRSKIELQESKIPANLFPSTHSSGFRDDHSRVITGEFLRDHIESCCESPSGLYPFQPPKSEVSDTDTPDWKLITWP